MSTKNYKFRVKNPSNMEYIDAQISAGHRHYNALIAVERERRERITAAQRTRFPALAALAAEVDQLDAARAEVDARTKALHKDRRSRQKSPEERQAVADARAALKTARERYKAMRDEANKDTGLLADFAAISEWATAEGKRLRAETQAWWGTYLQIEEAVQAAGKGPIPPKFKRWTGDGNVGCQLQGGVTWRVAIAGEDGRIKITPVPGLRSGQCDVTLRIGMMDGGRQPIVTTMRAYIDRRDELPPDAQIRWAKLLRRRIAGNYQWRLVLTMTGDLPEPQGHGHGTVAVDLGWRKTRDGLRVATWAGDDGEQGHLHIPDDWLELDRHISDTQSVRDDQFLSQRDLLAAWLDRTPDAPEWLRDRCRTIRHWKGIAQLAAVVVAWRDQRFAGDHNIYEDMERWRHADRLRWERMSHEARNLQNRRRDLYRRFAERLRKQYGRVVLRKINWAMAARKADLSTNEPHIKAQSHQRKMASPGLLEQTLAHLGPAVTHVADLPATCHRCGAAASADANIMQTCHACGAVWDQDINMAINLLRTAAPETAANAE